jgi:DNA-binding GntR family transcriptional regulator
MAFYKIIADAIRLDIERGRLKAGDKLPSMAEMKTVYRVSENTIKGAMIVLKAEGLVYGHSGVGVFVADPADR